MAKKYLLGVAVAAAAALSTGAADRAWGILDSWIAEPECAVTVEPLGRQTTALRGRDYSAQTYRLSQSGERAPQGEMTVTVTNADASIVGARLLLDGDGAGHRDANKICTKPTREICTIPATQWGACPTQPAQRDLACRETLDLDFEAPGLATSVLLAVFETPADAPPDQANAPASELKLTARLNDESCVILGRDGPQMAGWLRSSILLAIFVATFFLSTFGGQIAEVAIGRVTKTDKNKKKGAGDAHKKRKGDKRGKSKQQDKKSDD